MFDVQQFVADKQLEPFSFRDINGDEQELPNLLTLTGQQYDDFAKLLDTDPVAALTNVAPGIVGIIQATPLLALRPLIDAYLAHMREDPGKSEDSPDSSAITAKPSKRTSRASTKAPTRKR